MTSRFSLKFSCLSVLWMASLADAATITVSKTDNLQAKLDIANPGDIVQISAGATFTGHFTLRSNPCSPPATGPNPCWITIQSSAMASLPSAGTRVNPSMAKFMPKLVTPDTEPVLQITGGRNFYRIQGIEFTSGRRDYAVIISVGTGSETSYGELPHDIDFDRDYVHGDPKLGSHRGIALNSGATTVENCYISGIFNTKTQDTQAVGGWNGPGPYTITNNYLEASGENVFFGGAPTSIPGVVPSNILINRNDIYKPTTWMARRTDYWVKNLLEVKNGQNITIDQNSFTNCWVGADQLGWAIVLSVRDENGAVPQATVNHITITNNHFAHVGGGIFFLGHDSDGGGNAHDMTIRNNLWEDVGAFSTKGRLFEFLNGLSNITIDHNTAYQYGSEPWIEDYAIAPSSNIKVTNNIVNAGIGIGGDGTQRGLPTLDYYDYYQTGGSFMGNLVIGGPWPNPGIPDYPTSTTYKNGWVATASDASTSSYTGTDGQHPGCNGNVPPTPQ